MEPVSAMSSSLYIWEFVNTLYALIYIYQITCFSNVIMEINNYKLGDIEQIVKILCFYH